MRHLIPSVLPLALCALAIVPLSAQRQGGANRGAPRLGSFIEFRGGNKLEVSYTAITIAEGKFMKRIADMKKRGDADELEGFSERFNVSAMRRPLGKMTTKGNITVGGKEVAEGEYKLAFQLDNKCNWMVVLGKGDADEPVVRWTLKTTTPQVTVGRLNMSLAAGDQGGASLSVRFGDIAASLNVAAGKRKQPSSRRSGGNQRRRR